MKPRTARKQFSKREDRQRRWRSFKRHTRLILQPLVIAACAVGIWYALRTRGLYFSHEDETVLTGAIITTLAVAFSLIAAVVLNTIWENYRKIVVCVLTKDVRTFLIYRDERIPIAMHLLLSAFSWPLLAMIALLEYRNFWAGVASVFSVWYSVSLYWIIATQLQDPSKSAWLAERIPPNWFTKDIDQYFKLGEEEFEKTQG